MSKRKVNLYETAVMLKSVTGTRTRAYKVSFQHGSIFSFDFAPLSPL